MGTTNSKYLPKEKKNTWLKYDASELAKVMEYNEGYRKFISVCKTERECVTESIRLAVQRGYRDLKAVIAGGEKESGATVHFVDEGVDTGEIILQEKVPVMEGDTPEDLAARVLKVEHRILAEGLKKAIEKLGEEDAE